SDAKLGRVSCPLEHQNATHTRGAASPRSASPMGPAPTLLPRIALPLLTDHLLSRLAGFHVRRTPRTAGEDLTAGLLHFITRWAGVRRKRADPIASAAIA